MRGHTIAHFVALSPCTALEQPYPGLNEMWGVGVNAGGYQKKPK